MGEAVLLTDLTKQTAGPTETHSCSAVQPRPLNFTPDSLEDGAGDEVHLRVSAGCLAG